MASKYAQVGDCKDPLAIPSQDNMEEADVYVEGVLWARGINPADVTLPNAQLRVLAVTWAIRLAAIQGATGQESPLMDKAEKYKANAKLMEEQITRESLGLPAPTGSGGYGTVALGRG